MPIPLMTFVGESFAKKGFRFLYTGSHASCTKGCSLFSTCQQNLISGHVYEITEVMGRKLHCSLDLHEEDMVLVRVTEPKVYISVPNKELYLGSVTTFHPVGCEKTDCPHHHYCSPSELLIQDGEKIKLLSTKKKIENCPKGLYLSIVFIEKK